MTEREQFEAWARSVGWPHYATMPVTKGPDFFSDLSWDVWQAARAQSSTPNPVEVGTTVQAGQVLTESDIVKCLVAAGCVGTVKMSYDSGPYEITRTSINADRFARAIEQAVLAKREPMQQIGDGEFAPDAKLLELADKIDHEQNWRHSGIFQRDHLTQDQKDRVLAGVMLRRYADLMAPESWRLFPPKSVVSHSYRAATLEAVVKMAERHGIVGEKGGA